MGGEIRVHYDSAADALGDLDALYDAVAGLSELGIGVSSSVGGAADGIVEVAEGVEGFARALSAEIAFAREWLSDALAQASGADEEAAADVSSIGGASAGEKGRGSE